MKPDILAEETLPKVFAARFADLLYPYLKSVFEELEQDFTEHVKAEVRKELGLAKDKA